MIRSCLTEELSKMAEEMAHKYANLIIQESLKENKNPVKEMLDNLDGLAAYLREFMMSPNVDPSKRRPVIRSLMEEIRRVAPRSDQQALFLLSAILVYAKVLSFLGRDMLLCVMSI